VTIAAAAQNHPIVPVSVGLPLVDENGSLTSNGRQALQQLRDYIVNMNRTMPCNASTASNVITLTLLQIQPSVDQYVSYETYGFVADATTSGAVTALVVTATGTLATLNVYKANGATPAGAGDVVSGSQYFLTYVDSLNSSAGGFVLR
jgi:hypothetical protein